VARVTFGFPSPTQPRRGRLDVISPSPCSCRAGRTPCHAPHCAEFPQSRPQIFVHKVLGRRSNEDCGRGSGTVLLAVTTSHSMVIRSSGRILRARLHMMFLDAPAACRTRGAYICAATANVADGRRFIDRHGHGIRACAPVLTPLVTRGQHHGCAALSRRQYKYFGGTVDALITWGRRPPRGRPRGDHQARQLQRVERLIRVHPNLDRSWVPFTSSVHHLSRDAAPRHASSRGAGRRSSIPPSFGSREESGLRARHSVGAP